MNKVKILVVEPNRKINNDFKIYQKTIKNTIEEIYKLVYYPYKEIQMQKDIYVIYSKEATEKRDNSFRRNMEINGISIYGTFVVVKKKNNEFVSLADNEIKEFLDFNFINRLNEV